MAASGYKPHGLARGIWNLLHAHHRTAVLSVNRITTVWNAARIFLSRHCERIPGSSSAPVFPSLFANDQLNANYLPGEFQAANHPTVQHGPADSPLPGHRAGDR